MRHFSTPCWHAAEVPQGISRIDSEPPQALILAQNKTAGATAGRSIRGDVWR